MKTTRKARQAARRLFHLCIVDDRLTAARVRLVVRRIVESRRRGSLAVLTELERLVRLDRARHTAIIESAVPLPDEARQEIREALAHRYEPGLLTSFVQKPALVGGVRIKVGGEVYDGSVQGRLAAIEARLMNPAAAA